MNLARVLLNDFQTGSTGTVGEGQITYDTAPQTLPALNSAIRELYRELRITGGPSLIRDNVLVNLPANAVTGPSIQTYLGFQGYYDGATLNPTPTLPVDMMFPMELWEQQTGSVNALPFIRMCQPQMGLPSRNQTFALGEWEWRGGASFAAGLSTSGGDGLFFCGSLVAITIRIRYMAALLQWSGLSQAQFSTSYVPIMDCEEFLAYRVAYKVAAALSGINPGVAALKAEGDEAIRLLKLEQVRRQQTLDYHREPYESNIRSGYASADNLI